MLEQGINMFQKHSIKQKTTKQTINQNKRSAKKENEKTPKKKPYIKNYATPDRPPPAAVMLIGVVASHYCN